MFGQLKRFSVILEPKIIQAESAKSKFRSIKVLIASFFNLITENLTYIAQYLPSDIYQTEGKDIKIKIAGERFLMLSIYYFVVDDMPCKLKTYPKKKLNSLTLMQIEEGSWFEGILDFIVGVKNNKPFRVKELRNPSRLVIDFQH